MISRIRKQLTILTLAVLVLLQSQAPALACAICYGEPGNPMTVGLQKGVLILIGAIAGVLVAFAALIVFFAVRSRRLSRESELGESATGVSGPAS